MNLLYDWMDVSKISMTGCGGNKFYDSDNHCLILTAKNGWNSFYWNLPAILNQEIVFEFDYKFTNLDNYYACFVVNTNDFGEVIDKTIGIHDNISWTHYKIKISSTTQYIGINVRGNDNTGKSVTMALKNVQLCYSNSCKTQLYKNGNLLTNNFIENGKQLIENLYDTSYYTESDGSVWIRVFHHNNPSENLFTSIDTFSKRVYKSEDMWFNVALCNTNFSHKWELMVKQKATSTDDGFKYRWIQNVNPMTATFYQTTNSKVTINTNSGYSNLSTYGGLYRCTVNCSYLVINNSNENNWFGATGCWTHWNNGIPGALGRGVTTGFMDLYYRIDTEIDNQMKVYETGLSSGDFIEY